MRIGCCLARHLGAPLCLGNVEIARSVGFQFLECPVATLVPDEDEATFTTVLPFLGSLSLPVEVFNLFIPADLKIVGPDVDHGRVQRHAQTVLERARAAGAQVLVFGSGPARAIPPGFSRQTAISQIVSFLRAVPDMGIAVVIEPQWHAETNVINSVEEAVDLAQRVDRPAIQVMADLNHMVEEEEPLHHLLKYKDWVAHIHVADTDRLPPGLGTYAYAEFGGMLRQMGYGGRVSVECYWHDFPAEAGPTVQLLQAILT